MTPFICSCNERAHIFFIFSTKAPESMDNSVGNLSSSFHEKRKEDNLDRKQDHITDVVSTSQCTKECVVKEDRIGKTLNETIDELKNKSEPVCVLTHKKKLVSNDFFFISGKNFRKN